MRFTIKVKHWVFQHYLWLATGLFGLASIAVIKFGPESGGQLVRSREDKVVPSREDKVKLILAVAGGAVSFVFLVQKQKLQETTLFKELFTEFNKRYDALNEDLNRIRTETETIALKLTDRDVLYNYFNLCAEEHFFHSQGYIPEEVWQSWWEGMKYFFNCPRIRKEWEADPSDDSFYGFLPPEPDSYTPAAGALPGRGAADQSEAA